MSDPLNVHLTMAELLAGWPNASSVLAQRGMACVGCAMARFETVEEAAAAYGFNAAEFLDQVRRARRSHHSRSRRSSS